jgi:hypothetical protein
LDLELAKNSANEAVIVEGRKAHAKVSASSKVLPT